jgi:hypothetical protein
VETVDIVDILMGFEESALWIEAESMEGVEGLEDVEGTPRVDLDNHREELMRALTRSNKTWMAALWRHYAEFCRLLLHFAKSYIVFSWC